LLLLLLLLLMLGYVGILLGPAAAAAGLISSFTHRVIPNTAGTSKAV
jgi:hypothetical protein